MPRTDDLWAFVRENYAGSVAKNTTPNIETEKVKRKLGGAEAPPLLLII